MGYYDKRDIIYKIGTAKFRKLCLLGMTASQKIKAVDKALKEKGISTDGWGPEDYQEAIKTIITSNDEVEEAKLKGEISTNESISQGWNTIPETDEGALQ